MDLKLWVDERLRQQTRKSCCRQRLRELPVVLRAKLGRPRDCPVFGRDDSAGRCRPRISLVLDITEWKQAEEARTKSQKQLQQILTRPDCMLWRAA